jgi:hypothetical protein
MAAHTGLAATPTRGKHVPADPTPRRTSGAHRRRRKNLYVDQPKIERVKALLGTSTETEAIDRALDLAEDWAVFDREASEGLASRVGRGDFIDRFRPTRKRR